MTEVPSEQVCLAEMRRVTWLGMLINLVLSLVKVAAGIFARSQVLIADAVHSLSDLSTDVAILVGSRYWGRPADDDHPYGHKKIETIVTLFIGLVLGSVAYKLIVTAIERIHLLIQGEQIPLPGWFAFWAAIFSIFLKEWLYRYTDKIGRKVKSEAILANACHHRSDALSSIPAALAVAVTRIFGEKYTFLDPVGTIVVSCMIVYTAFLIIRPTLATLLDRGASHLELIEMKTYLQDQFPEILGIHHIRTRPLGGGSMSMDLHIEVDPLMTLIDAHNLSHQVNDAVTERFPEIAEVIPHVEPKGFHYQRRVK